MYSFLRTPRWLAGLLVVVVVLFTFVSLGNWQLRRHRDVTFANTINASRLDSPALDLSELLNSVGSSIDSLEYRRATSVGSFDPANEVLVRNQVNDGIAGFHVVTPFLFDGGAILVNRGWVPLEFDDPPVATAPPPEGEVEIDLVLRISQTRPRFGRIEPDGQLSVVNRIDIDRIGKQVGVGIAPVWGQLVEPTDGTLPDELAVPEFSDNGPHLAYAFQWFAFAVITLVGSALLIRSSARKTTGRKRES